MNNYMSAFDLRQRELDLQKQKQTAESLDEIEALEKTIIIYKERIKNLLNPEHII